MKLKNENRGWKIENGKAVLALFLLLSTILYPPSSPGQTPVYDYGYLAPGLPQTNPVVIQAWPQANAWITFNVTNTVYVITTTNLPNTAGYWSNSFYPTTYRKTIPALNAVMYFTVPNASNTLSVAQCATAIAASGPSLSSYGLITNWLGYAPAIATPAGITNVLGYIPATNGGAIAYSQLPYTPPTNTYAGLTNVLSFIPATNGGPLSYSQMPYTPPTNTYAALTNVLGFIPATNAATVLASQLNYSVLTNVLGFVPATNVFGVNTNLVFLGQNSTNTAYYTNGVLQRTSTP